jgi:SAM-dependent methyltransferase
LTPSHAWTSLLDLASAPYRAAGRFAWRFARGKLSMDPVFRHLIEAGHLRPGARVLDIGCGQGLLASLFAAIDDLHAKGGWPAAWPAAPTGARYVGLELMPKDVERARAAVGDLPSRPSFVCANMVDAVLPPSDVVVILDVLHYVDHAAQERVLAKVRASLAPTRGRLLLRVGDAGSRRGFAVSQWVDRIVTFVRGHRVAPTFGRPLAGWVGVLKRHGFAVQPVPMSRGTPFANVLLVADAAPPHS